MSHLIIVGFDEIVSNKYLTSIEDAVRKKAINGYSIIDLKSQKQFIEQRLAKVSFQPKSVFYLPENFTTEAWSNETDYEDIILGIAKKEEHVKVYIATELRAHEGYLKFCIDHGIDSLVEKPVLAPMSTQGFVSNRINSTMRGLTQKAAETGSKHSVMSLGRYHPIYNDIVLSELGKLVAELQAPVTSFHLRAAGGVWNLHREYESREDHPYKYGYGMLMHGAYHYIDLVSQFILLNRLVYPDQQLRLTLSSYGAYPSDQNSRIPKKYREFFDDDEPNWSDTSSSTNISYGETDIVTSFRLQDVATNKTITLGTLSFEQTTPSIRNWKDIPEGLYNKNGRTSRVDIEAQLSTMHAVNVECYDVPVKENGQVDRIDAFARVSTRTNAALLPEKEYTETRTFSGIFHSESNKKLMHAWLTNTEAKSSLESHILPMYLIEILAESLKNPGQPLLMEI